MDLFKFAHYVLLFGTVIQIQGEVKLTASDGTAMDQFGYSVAISGDYAIIGAFKDDDNRSSSGGTYIYR